MTKATDARHGDEYRIVEPGFVGNYLYVGTKRDGSVVLRDLETDNTLPLSYHQFATMRSQGTAVRTVREGIRTATDSLGPFTILDPEDRAIGKRQRESRRRARTRAVEAMTLHFYVNRFDQSGQVPKSDRQLRCFLEENYEEAQRSGFEWLPSPSAIRRALKIGKLGNRPLGLFLERRKHKRESRWPRWVLELKAQLIKDYWNSRTAKGTAIDEFLSKFDEARSRLGALSQKPPGRQTIYDWLYESENKENYAKRFGSRNAHKRYVGTVPTIKATKPLEYVLVDQTETDLWLQVKDANDVVIGSQRAWLVYALDLYSRMVLGFNLTFEPPSVHTLMRCLKHSCMYKSELVEEFGEHKGATDGYGKASTYIFDNGPENTGVSLQTTLQNIGSNWIYASTRTPEHKAQVERLFGTTNGLWHQLPGGRPGGKNKNKLVDEDARERASLTLAQATRRLRQFLVTVYHVEKSSGIGMAPARKWKEGLPSDGRQSIDDMNVLNRVFGSYFRVALTTAGVRFKNQVFHDPSITTKLIQDIGSSRKQREQREPGQTMVLKVSAIVNLMDCSSISIINERNGLIVTLPNVNATSTAEMSYEHAKQLKKYAEAKNLAFHSEEERIAARHELFFEHENAIKNTSKPRKRAIRTYVAEALSLEETGQIIEDEVEPTVSGMHGYNIPTTASVTLRRNHGLEPKGPVRGKRVVPKLKAVPNAASLQPKESPKPSIQNLRIVNGLSSEEEAAAFLDQLANNKSERW